jgi:hypothetical protein
MNNEIGKVRQSTVLMNYGPGAIINFRVPGTGAAVSVVAAGLEQWEIQADAVGASGQDLRRFTERRLCEKLKVRYFRMPPVAAEGSSSGDDEDTVIPLIGVRFPTWLQCPRCNKLKPARRWGNNPGDPSRFCNVCSRELPGDHKQYVVPAGFVTACRSGHLDEFPWSDWIHEGGACSNRTEFLLETKGAGLAGMLLTCGKCKRSRTMEHAFAPDAHAGRRCEGARPWLVNGREDCTQPPITMQRGASNLYFPRLEGALVIPPWSERILRQIGYRWNELESISTREQRHQYIESVWEQLALDLPNVTQQAFKELVDEKISQAQESKSGNLRWDEYRQFMLSNAQRESGDEFDVRAETVPTDLPHLASLLRVVSIREIRALKSFTRIEALPGRPPVRSQLLSREYRQWLPAIEVRGEGIFLALDRDRLARWEGIPAVQARAQQIASYQESAVLNPDGVAAEFPPNLCARYLLLHALAHVLMKQLSLQCGYSSASLRELLYVGDGARDMAGLMIYTATSDSDGTLGGLQRQGEAGRMRSTLLEAIRGSEWCSSDPLCIGGYLAATEAANLAACHSCLLAPETSCQDFNRFLDRAMLVGTDKDRSIGFFSELLAVSRTG